MNKRRFKKVYVIEISGDATSHLELSIEELLIQTILPLIFTLKNKHGWVDKQNHDIQGSINVVAPNASKDKTSGQSKAK